MRSLREIFESRPADARHSGKWEHYFEIYERHLGKYRGRRLTLLEIGVQNGGSIDVYREYFGEGLRYVGVDIDPRVREVGGREGVAIEVGSSADRGFLARVAQEHGPIDVVIDDGSHVPLHQIAAFESLYPTMTIDGVYLVEDLHASYFPGIDYRGGRYARTTFLQVAQRLADSLHDHVYDDRYYAPRLATRGASVLARVESLLSPLARSDAWRRLRNQPPTDSDARRSVTRSVHFYPYVVVIERGEAPTLHERSSGRRLLEGRTLT